MRAIGTALLALGLAAASAARAPRIEVIRDQRSADAQLSDTPAHGPAIALRRRDAHPDRGRAPGLDTLAALGTPFGFAPPRRTWRDLTGDVTARPARPLPLPRTSRGPPLG